MDQVLEAVLGVEAVDLAVRVALRVVPEENVDAVREEDDGANAGALLEGLRVLARLLCADLGILRGLLRLHDRERLAVVALKDVVSEAISRGSRQPGKSNLLPNLLGVLALFPDRPTSRDQRLVDQPVARSLLVEFEERSHPLALGLDACQLGGVIRGGAFGGEPRFGLLMKLRERRVVLRFGEAQLFERILVLCRAVDLRRWRDVLGDRGAIATIDDVEPVGDVEQVGEVGQRELHRDRSARMRGVVARFADRVQLVLDDFRHGLPKRLLVHQVVEVVREWWAQPEQLVDQHDDLLDETPLFQQRACGIRMHVLLREAGQIGQHRPLRSKELEVLRLHVRHLLARDEHDASTHFRSRAITSPPCTCRASCSASGNLPTQPASPLPSCCRRSLPWRASGSGERHGPGVPAT